MKNKKILFIVNNLKFFFSHRRQILFYTLSHGYDSYFAGPEKKEIKEVQGLINKGGTYEHLFVNRFNKGIIKELHSIVDIFRLLLKVKPDIAHLVTIRINIFGGIACRILGVKAVVYNISGLGHVFIAQGLKAKIRKFFVLKLYKFALNHKNSKVIFQNQTDQDEFIGLNLVKGSQARLVKGSGVDLQEFDFFPEPEGPIKILFAARLTKEKGVEDWLKAIPVIQSKFEGIKFLFAGEIDKGNPSSLSESELESLSSMNGCVVLGHQQNMPSVIKNCHIVVLPSFREGLPKVLIEASAIGRPAVTTDVPGCRDIIKEGFNGLLVPVNSPLALAEATIKLINDKNLREQMGRSGRKLVEQEFDVNIVVEKIASVYTELGI